MKKAESVVIGFFESIAVAILVLFIAFPLMNQASWVAVGLGFLLIMGACIAEIKIIRWIIKVLSKNEGVSK